MSALTEEPGNEEDAANEPDMGVVTRDVAHAARILAAIPQLHADAPDPSDLEPSRVRTAYHEAGHAVVARALGIEVEDVRLESDCRGCCRMDHNVRLDGHLVYSAVTWAGFVGESAAAAFSVYKFYDYWFDRCDDGDDAPIVERLSVNAPDAAAAGVLIAASIISAKRAQLNELAHRLLQDGSARPDPASPAAWLSPA